MADAGYRHFPPSPTAADTHALRMITADAATVCYCTVSAAVLFKRRLTFYTGATTLQCSQLLQLSLTMVDAGYRHSPLSPPAADTHALRMLTADAATVCYCTVSAAVLFERRLMFCTGATTLQWPQLQQL